MRRPTLHLSRSRLIDAVQLAAAVTAFYLIMPLLEGEPPRLGLMLTVFPVILLLGYQVWPAIAPLVSKQRVLEAVGVVTLSLVVAIASKNAIVLLTGMREGYAFLIVYGAAVLGYAAYRGIRRSWSGLSRAEHRSTS